jgi:glycosyltransferase involved in cell wall biosynthesis
MKFNPGFCRGFLLLMNQRKQLRIGFYCSSTSWGGLEMNVLRHAAWMKERGSEVVLFCVNDSPLYHESKNVHMRVDRVVRNKKYGDRKNARKLAEKVGKHELDVLWIRDNRDMSVTGICKRYLKKRNIVLLYQQAMQLGVNKKDFIHTRRYSKIDIWISPLKFLADQVADKTRFPSERVHIIPLGLDVQKLLYQSIPQTQARFELDLDTDVPMLGIIGRFDPLKGQMFVVNALLELRKKFPNLQLLLVGEKTKGEAEEYFDDLQKTIERYGLSKAVHIRPFMANVGTFYKAVDVFVMASEGETFGMVTIEAMLFGCKIIGTNTSGTPELLDWGEYGELYTPGKIREFCQAYETLMIDEQRAEQKAKNAAKVARERYDHYAECEAIENVIHEELEKKRK